MKNTKLFVLMIFLSLGAFSTVNASALNSKPVPKEIPAEVEVMLNRLEEIKEMDKSSLDKTEKKELRKEVREIKDVLKTSGNGIYISTSVIIIILLVIILL